MNARQKVNNWLMELGVIVDKSFRLNPEGVFVAEDGEGNEFVVEVPDEDGLLVYIYSPLFDLPTKKRERFYEKLLSWNLYGDYTQLATLSVDLENKKVVLHYVFPIENLDAVSFSNLFNNFVETAGKIKADGQELLGASDDDEIPDPREISSLRKSWQIQG